MCVLIFILLSEIYILCVLLFILLSKICIFVCPLSSIFTPTDCSHSCPSCHNTFPSAIYWLVNVILEKLETQKNYRYQNCISGQATPTKARLSGSFVVSWFVWVFCMLGLFSFTLGEKKTIQSLYTLCK